jgi:hypothetical protein
VGGKERCQGSNSLRGESIRYRCLNHFSPQQPPFYCRSLLTQTSQQNYGMLLLSSQICLLPIGECSSGNVLLTTIGDGCWSDDRDDRSARQGLWILRDCLH